MATVMAGRQSAPSVDRAAVQAERLFYVIAAYAMLILTAVGFQNFYLHGRAAGGREMTGQILPLIVTHGLAMSGWIMLFCIQSTLILMGNRRLHMVIGPVGGVLAAAIVVLGSTVAAMSVHFNPELYGPLGGPRFFLMIMLSEMVLFGTFVGLGIANRHRAEVHRPMMLLATIVILSGSLVRTPYVVNLAVPPPLRVRPVAVLRGTAVSAALGHDASGEPVVSDRVCGHLGGELGVGGSRQHRAVESDDRHVREVSSACGSVSSTVVPTSRRLAARIAAPSHALAHRLAWAVSMAALA